MTTSAGTQVQQPVVNNWWLLLVWGLLTTLIGLYLIFLPEMTVVILIQVMAVFWLIGGLLDVMGALVRRDAQWLWRLVGGIIGILAGLVLLSAPLLGALFTVGFLFFLMVFAAIINGVINIITGGRIYSQGGGEWSWGHFFLGVLQIFVGLFLLAHPLTGTLAFVLVLGAFNVISGIGAVALALRLRRLSGGAMGGTG